MTKIKNTIQGTEAKETTEKDHANGKPISEILNKVKIKNKRRLIGQKRCGKLYSVNVTRAGVISERRGSGVGISTTYQQQQLHLPINASISAADYN